jgi:hypothetical protein
VGASASRLGPRWLVTVAGIALAAPVWWRALTSPTIWPDPRATRDARGLRWAALESIYFYLTASLLIWAVGQFAHTWFQLHPGYAAAVVAAAYLAAGYSAPRQAFATAGVAALTVAVITVWRDQTAVYLLAALAVGWATLDHWLERADGRWYGVATLVVAIWWSLGTAALRSPADPAFIGGWAAGVWLCVAAAVGLAARAWRRMPADAELGRHVPRALWGAAGLLLLLGVTGELLRFFRQTGLPGQTARLWGGLSVSAWWAAFAGVLVLIGFRRGIREARIAGLIVAGLAIAKVLLVDLSSLDALYRVASVFILGLVSLLLAYLYHRRAQQT